MLFFSPEIPDGTWKLNEEESRHIKVLRLREGETLRFTNGLGERVEVQLDKSDKYCVLTTLKRETVPSNNPNIHLFLAPTKNADRIEWLVEKAVEIGIRSITFLVCEHSERVRMKPDRVERVAVSALKQSMQFTLPQLNFDIKFNEAWKQAQGKKLLAHCEDGEKIQLSTWKEKHESLSIFIGPEGDFSKNEIALANQEPALSLGANRLRTETAALKALIAAHEYFER
jgi:16S rRNA (uracil1498-N3)-methyltransferase